ncbi:MAG: hypothetical protein ABSG91_19380 [Syntrophobacteraceae bacterium]
MTRKAKPREWESRKEEYEEGRSFDDVCSGDKLTLTDSRGKEVKYLRVKEAKAAEHGK